MNAFEALLDTGIAGGQTLLQPRQIHAGCHQQAAELIVQLARQRRFFLLRDVLQMRRQGGQFPGTFIDLLFQFPLLIAQIDGLAGAPAHIAVDQADGEQNQSN